MLMCMENVYVVGGYKWLANGCSWLAVAVKTSAFF